MHAPGAEPRPAATPRFAEPALATSDLPPERLTEWYRRFRRDAPDAAERVLATAIASGSAADVDAMMFAAVTDHVFVDEGHTLDFTTRRSRPWPS